MPTNITDLPLEILHQIVLYFELVRPLAQLALTCKTLHDYVYQHGFSVWSHAYFPTCSDYPGGPEAARGLTDLARAWSRKALTCEMLAVPNQTVRIRKAQTPVSQEPAPRRVGRQTIGFQPVIDCYEHFPGNGWQDRREVLAYGAGAELRISARGPPIRHDEDFLRQGRRHPTVKWTVWKDQAYVEGADDITAVHLLRPRASELRSESHCESMDGLNLNSNTVDDPDSHEVIVGRANGQLERVRLDTEVKTITTFETAGREVSRSDLNPDQSTLCVSLKSSPDESAVCFYRADSSASSESPLATIPSKTKAIRYLSSRRLALGDGVQGEQLRVFESAPDRISSGPTWQYGRSDTTASVYALCPLAAGNAAHGAPGDLFLSGWYDGTVLLHDVRSPSGPVAFIDTIDRGAVYSLLTMGDHCFLVGNSRDCCLAIFDLRMTSWQHRSYQPRWLDECAQRTEEQILTGIAKTNHYPAAFVLHKPAPRRSGEVCTPPDSACLGAPRQRCQYHEQIEVGLPEPDIHLWLSAKAGLRRDSAIYALARASECSSTIYMGMQGVVCAMDIADYPPDISSERQCLQMSMMPMDARLTDHLYSYPDRHHANEPIHGWSPVWHTSFPNRRHCGTWIRNRRREITRARESASASSQGT